jgi:hypothetical protein
MWACLVVEDRGLWPDFPSPTLLPTCYVRDTLDWNDFRPVIVKIETFQLSVSPDHYISYGDQPIHYQDTLLTSVVSHLNIAAQRPLTGDRTVIQSCNLVSMNKALTFSLI